MKAILIKHDGTSCLMDDANGDVVIHEEVRYKAVAVLSHPKTGETGVRVMVAEMALPKGAGMFVDNAKFYPKARHYTLVL